MKLLSYRGVSALLADQSEKLGTQTQSVTVADGETKEIVFKFAVK